MGMNGPESTGSRACAVVSGRRRPAVFQRGNGRATLVRDEGVEGSNPFTPTIRHQSGSEIVPNQSAAGLFGRIFGYVMTHVGRTRAASACHASSGLCFALP